MPSYVFTVKIPARSKSSARHGLLKALARGELKGDIPSFYIGGGDQE